MIEKKISYITELLKLNKYEITEDDVKDITKQLQTKPIELYVLTIDYFNEKNIKVDYENIVEFIRGNVKVRNMLRNIITPFEEASRVAFIDDINKRDDYDGDNKKTNRQIVNRVYNTTFSNVITRLDLPVEEEKLIKKIKGARNKVNHISYPILFNEVTKIINILDQAKKFEFINKYILEENLREIRDEIKFIDFKLKNDKEKGA